MIQVSGPFDYLLLGAAVLLLIGVLTSKASYQLGVPALLLFLVVGMLAGSEGPGGIYFDDVTVAQRIGIVALSYILFSGGLDTRWAATRPVLRTGVALASIGVVLTAGLVGLMAIWFFDFSAREGLLLGAIISSTDAAAVFGVLRSKRVRLKDPLKPLLELESGSNDPMAVVLTIGILALLTEPDTSSGALVSLFLKQAVLGAALGWVGGRILIVVVNRLRLEYEGLYPVLTLAMVLLTYSATASLGGSGFLAVYIAGLVLGNAEFIHKGSLVRFHDGVAWLMQIAMFLTLGLLVFPSQLVPVIGSGLALAFFLIFVARPLAVFLTLLPVKMPVNHKLFVSWVGLKGAVPIILATFPLAAGIHNASLLFNVVFFAVLTSVLVQGSSIPFMARWLGVQAPAPEHPALDASTPVLDARTSTVQELVLGPRAPYIGKQIVEADLPDTVKILAIHRGNFSFVPTGATILEEGDRLLLLADSAALVNLRRLV